MGDDEFAADPGAPQKTEEENAELLRQCDDATEDTLELSGKDDTQKWNEDGSEAIAKI